MNTLMLTTTCLGVFVALAAATPVPRSRSLGARSKSVYGESKFLKKPVLYVFIAIISILVLLVVVFIFCKYCYRGRKGGNNNGVGDDSLNVPPRAGGMRINLHRARPTSDVRGGLSHGDTVTDAGYAGHAGVKRHSRNNTRRNPYVYQPILPTPPAPALHSDRRIRRKPLPGNSGVELMPISQGAVPQAFLDAVPQTSQGTVQQTLQDTVQPTLQDTVQPTPQDTVQPTPQDAVPQTFQIKDEASIRRGHHKQKLPRKPVATHWVRRKH